MIHIYALGWLVLTAFCKWPIAHSSDGRGSNMMYFWNDSWRRKTITLYHLEKSLPQYLSVYNKSHSLL